MQSAQIRIKGIRTRTIDSNSHRTRHTSAHTLEMLDELYYGLTDISMRRNIL
jgi:hypothetical protein